MFCGGIVDIGQVGEGSTVVLDPVAQTRIRITVVDLPGAHMHTPNRDGLGLQLVHRQQSADAVVEEIGDRAVGSLHLAQQRVAQSPAIACATVDADVVAFDEERCEERDALDVIPVEVAQEHVRLGAGSESFTHQTLAQPMEANTGVEDDDLTRGAPNLDTGCVSTVLAGGGTRIGYGATCAPQLDAQISVLRGE